MSSKIRARTASSDRTPWPVSNQATVALVRTDTEDKLWEALHANPNSTAADLSTTAKMGKSTAQKILAKWATDGSVARTPGIADGGRRAADLWAIAATTAAAAPTDPPAGDASTQENNASTDIEPDESGAPVPTEPEATDIEDATAAEEVLLEPADGGTDNAPEAAQPEQVGTTPTEATLETTEPDTIQPADTEAAITDATESADSVTVDHDAKPDSRDDGKPERLAPGALRGLVEDHLRDHSGEQFGPTAIAKALGGKSSGAVCNALDKLVADGTAVKTNDKPRRFALAPAESAVTAAPTN